MVPSTEKLKGMTHFIVTLTILTSRSILVLYTYLQNPTLVVLWHPNEKYIWPLFDLWFLAAAKPDLNLKPADIHEEAWCELYRTWIFVQVETITVQNSFKALRLPLFLVNETSPIMWNKKRDLGHFLSGGAV